MKHLVSLIAVCLVFAACPPKRVVIEEAPPRPNDDNVEVPPPPPSKEIASYQILEMLRTNCMGGKCRNYSIKIWSTGVAEFNGVANVERTGRYFGELTKAQIEGLKAAANAANLYSLSDSYPTDKRWMVDMPSVMITYRDGDLVKNIRDNYNSPKALQDFEAYVDKLIQETEWHIVD